MKHKTLLLTSLFFFSAFNLKAQWSLSGNSGTNSFNYVGTSDAVGLQIKTNNTARIVIASTGAVSIYSSLGVGTLGPNPNAKLDVNGNVFASGKVAIGTTDTAKMSGYSLVVNGEAIFNKAKVKLYSAWPDFVFEDKYGLMPISRLEAFIRLNKHLPGIPAAEDVNKNGIDLGANQALLLQKIEELTLYIIELNKKLEMLEKENLIIKEKLAISANQ